MTLTLVTNKPPSLADEIAASDREAERLRMAAWEGMELAASEFEARLIDLAAACRFRRPAAHFEAKRLAETVVARVKAMLSQPEGK